MILITGANGFVGQNLVPQLIKFYPVKKTFCLVYSSGKKHEKKGMEILVKHGVKVINGDLTKKSSLKLLKHKYSTVIHLAASVDTANSDFRANDIGTENLYQSIGPLGKIDHFIFVSTAAVWAGRMDCKKLISENTSPVASNEYGRTKLTAENWLIEQSKKDGFKLTILRLNTVYGADPRADKLFGVMKKYIASGSIISRVNWPGKFGLVHVSDVVKTIITLTIKPVPGNFNLFVVTTENITLESISKLMHKAMGLKYKQFKVPNFVWKFAKRLKFISVLEKILPNYLYNSFWRLLLILDDVLAASPEYSLKKLPKWKRKRIKDHMQEVINA